MNNYFYLQAIDKASVIKLYNNRNNAPDIKYSKNGTNWTQWDYTNLTIDKNTKMYFKGNNGTQFSKSLAVYSTFRQIKINSLDPLGDVVAGGNIMSLLDDGACTSTEVGEYCFHYLFNEFTYLDIDDSFILPATKLLVPSHHWF